MQTPKKNLKFGHLEGNFLGHMKWVLENILTPTLSTSIIISQNGPDFNKTFKKYTLILFKNSLIKESYFREPSGFRGTEA